LRDEDRRVGQDLDTFAAAFIQHESSVACALIRSDAIHTPLITTSVIIQTLVHISASTCITQQRKSAATTTLVSARRVRATLITAALPVAALVDICTASSIGLQLVTGVATAREAFVFLRAFVHASAVRRRARLDHLHLDAVARLQIRSNFVARIADACEGAERVNAVV